MKIFVLVLFLAMYVAIIALPKFKWIITGVCAAAVLIAGAVGFSQAFTDLDDYNVILMMVGIMLTVGFFADSNMPSYLADRLVSKIPDALIAITLLCVLSGLISAFIDNVATVLMLAPVGIAVSKKIKISPIPVIISIAVSSNLQGAATLVGDTTSIMLGAYANMSFSDFFFIGGRPSIFWAVEIGALATIPVILFIFRKDKKKLELEKSDTKIKSFLPTVWLLLTIILLVVFSFIPDKPIITNGLICTSIGVVAFICDLFVNKKQTFKVVKDAVDYKTVLFLFFLFIIIKAVESVGIIGDVSNFFVSVGANSIILLYVLIVLGSVVFSAFIDNIPYVATMLPVIGGIVAGAGVPDNIKYLLFFGLLIGATLGGNLTPVGASANVVGIGILEKEGYKVTFKDFIRIGVPFTAVAVIVGALVCFLCWGL